LPSGFSGKAARGAGEGGAFDVRRLPAPRGNEPAARSRLQGAEDQPIIEKLPSILDHLCADCGAHFEAVRRYLTDRQIAFELRPRLVRGLDYYMRTTFEVIHGGLGAQNSVLGGGRYDGLAESLGSKVHAPGIGFSIGEDRLVMTLEQTAGEPAPRLDLFMAPLGEAALSHAALLARDLRRLGLRWR